MDKETFKKAEKLKTEIDFLTTMKQDLSDAYAGDQKIGFTLRLHYKGVNVELSEQIDFLSIDEIKKIIQNQIHKAESLFKDL